MKNRSDAAGAPALRQHGRVMSRIQAWLKSDVAFWPLRGRPWTIGACDGPFRLGQSGAILLDEGLDEADLLIAARLAGELAWLTEAGAPDAVAGLAAARSAAQFAFAERLTSGCFDWIGLMGGDPPPPADRLAGVWRTLAPCHGAASDSLPAEAAARIASLWPVLGTAEAIMETGGDIRLLRDPQSDLNGYGCSHRPRPWAVTFASSTASSISERGYEAADRIRLKVTTLMLTAGDRRAIHAEAGAVRRAIGRAFGIPRGGAVVLAASGTDSELLALALSHLPVADRPITTILLAPEETGSGVPMAATGRHFAVDTANGHDVSRSAPIEGFRGDTALVSIPLRDPGGAIRPGGAVHADIETAIAVATEAGRRVILHALDLSKTGLLAPSMDLLRDLRARFGAELDIVVDACQLRIAPERIAAYLDLDAVVLVTGSKFLTGPPFAGAALLPPSIAKRLDSGRLPAGLDAYFGRSEWPSGVRAAKSLPPTANYGLLLRWRAALAEYRAFARVDEARKTAIVARFAATVRDSIARHAMFVLLPVPDPSRESAGWDTLRSVFGFAVRMPGDSARLLDPAAMRKLYHWLNADCSVLFEDEAERRLAARICHIGQPVALPDGAGGQVGWLRVSAGARLISGEPSHRGLAASRRLDREMADLALVFDKIALLHAHWARLQEEDPAPRYR
ncbi:MAG TPA: hypothetical protein VF286_03550 [Acidiphilium sp.]